ncbi:ADP-ribosylation factor [Hondaea fermentalgiana]|uniref:ADP-ribosylation factor n=1 Tax=Hondaea fermentalgiana TaxID=2315210 RepID=A0A2R5G5Z0_9STRA|nr:ADP-ribosylation factor [Hondaea fermentalgiana]|eukprot:GBG26456.1 ADP-ribosylation factor [Hondaea fermentalgiana]
MGSELSRHLQAWKSWRVRRILLVGLDSAGKTTCVRLLKGENPHGTLPTTESEFVEVKYKHHKLVITDVGGQAFLRPYWRHHYTGTQGIIFVVDSMDTGRFDDALEELRVLLVDAQLDNVPLVVFANKQDQPGAATIDQVRAAFVTNNDKLGARPVSTVAGSALSGDGFYEGLDWLLTKMHRL